MISVIIPVYNVEKYLKRCLDSIINQSYKDLEIILVNDGSKDNSGAICEEFKANDSRIKVIHKSNGGLSSARNAGVDICKGDYIFFIDSDDWLADDYVLENFYKTSVKEKSDFVYARINSANDEKVCPREYIKKYGDTKLQFLSNPYYFSAWNKLFSRELIGLLHFTEGRVNEDVDIIPLVFCKAKNISLLNEYTYNYYSNPNSITRSGFSEKRFDMFKSVKHVYDNFKGTREERNVFIENLFGFQLFSVYIEILKKTKGKERRFNINKFIKLIKENGFSNYYKVCFVCFMKYENFTRIIKKTAALLYLRLISLFSGR